MADVATTSLRAIGITSNLILAGFSFCSSQLAVPRLYDINIDDSTRAFADFYHKGAMTVVPLTMLSAGVAASAAYVDSDNATSWAVTAVLAILPLGWTRLKMQPTNMELVNLSNSDSQRQRAGPVGVKALLRQWVSYNYLRTVSYFAAGLVGLSVLLRQTHGQSRYL